MPRRLIILALVVALAGCGAARRTPGAAGAVSYSAPPVTATVLGTGPQAGEGTAGLRIGGTPVTATHLHSGAKPGASPSVTLRGTTRVPKKPKPPPVLPLATGGYEAETFVFNKTGPANHCRVVFALRAAGRGSVFRSPARPAGRSAATFVVHTATKAKLVVSGPVGCAWTLVLFPA